MTPNPDPPRVTIITPSLNQGLFLGATLRSVAAQDYPDVEHIVMDGGSTDGSVELLEDWASSHPVTWRSQPDRGQADAIQEGLGLATGSIVAWLNSDDIYLDNHVITNVVATFEPGVDAITGGGWYISEFGIPIRAIPVFADRLDYATLRCVDWVLQPATFMRRDVMERFPLDLNLHYAFDWDLFIRVAREIAITPVQLEMAGYRIHGAGKTVSGGSRRQRELAEVFRRYNSGPSPRSAWLSATTAIHNAGEHLPPVAYRALTWGLDRIAAASQILTGGKGFQS